MVASPLIRMGLVSLATTNLKELEHFYEELLGVAPVAQIPEVYAEFRLSGLRLGLYRSTNQDYKACLGATSICLQVSSLERVLELPILKGMPISETRQDFHGREADFCDPDGNRVVVHEPSRQFWWLIGES